MRPGLPQSARFSICPASCGILSPPSIKSELFTDFHLQGENIEEEMAAYIKFFNEERPAYSLGYLTPRQYRETYAAVK